jgi:hypothetical protein
LQRCFPENTGRRQTNGSASCFAAPTPRRSSSPNAPPWAGQRMLAGFMGTCCGGCRKMYFPLGSKPHSRALSGYIHFSLSSRISWREGNPFAVPKATGTFGVSLRLRFMSDPVWNDLVLAKCHVARAQQLLARQRQIVASLEERGQRSTLAKQLLASFEDALELHTLSMNRCLQEWNEMPSVTPGTAS